MLAAAIAANAEGYRTLSVNQTDGTKVEVTLSDNLSAYFEEGLFVVTGTDAEVTVDQSQIKSFTFLTTSAIGEVAAPGSPAPVVAGGRVSVSGLAAGSQVSVCTAAGVVVASHELAEGGSVEVDMASFAAGVYVVNVNGVSYKVGLRK